MGESEYDKVVMMSFVIHLILNMFWPLPVELPDDNNNVSTSLMFPNGHPQALP